MDHIRQLMVWFAKGPNSSPMTSSTSNAEISSDIIASSPQAIDPPEPTTNQTTDQATSAAMIQHQIAVNQLRATAVPSPALASPQLVDGRRAPPSSLSDIYASAEMSTCMGSDHDDNNCSQSEPRTTLPLFENQESQAATSCLANQFVLNQLHIDAQASQIQQMLAQTISSTTAFSVCDNDNFASFAEASIHGPSSVMSRPETSFYRLGISPELGYAARPRPNRIPTTIIPGFTRILDESSGTQYSPRDLVDNTIASGSIGAQVSENQISDKQPNSTRDFISAPTCEASTQVKGGPTIAEMRISHSSPSVVTPTDSFPDPMMPTMPTTNNPFATGYGHRDNFPAGIDVSCADVPTYTYGRIRRYSHNIGRYGQWEPLLAFDPVRNCDSGLYMDRPCVVQLKRGGMIRYFPRIVSEHRRCYLAQKCRDFEEYRQYKFGPGGLANEPRVHVLLSSSAASSGIGCDSPIIAPGYQYHGIRMQAQPLSIEPAFEALSTELAATYQFPNQEWNIGCDAIVYRNGNDNIGWHSDDTQGESKVTCIVPECPGERPRPVYVRPKKNAKTPLQDGDEEIQLFVRQGDGYEMDGVMQDGYEHCLPKVKKVQGLRSALIFRQGRVAAVHDSGNRIADIAEGRHILAPPAPLPTIIGHPPFSSNIIEGNDSYSRAELFLTRVHRCDRRGVCGNIESGAESIVVSRQDGSLREEDGLQWIKYTSSRRQGGGGFATSFKKKQAIRVFRSSSLNNEYAPPPRPLGNTSYRYDGLYRVLFMWDEKGNRVEEGPSPNGAQYTFLLRRLPKMQSSGGEGVVGNNLSTNELWRNICERKGKVVRPFVPVQPTTHLKELPLLPPTNRQRKAAGEKREGGDNTPSNVSVPSHAVDNPATDRAGESSIASDELREEKSNISDMSTAKVDILMPNSDNDNEKKIEINWVQCDECNKWRILREGIAEGSWICTMNTSDPCHSNCAAPEESEDDYIQSLEDEYEEDDGDDNDYVPPPTAAQINDIINGKGCDDIVTRKLEPIDLKMTRKRKRSDGSIPRKSPRLSNC